MENNNLDLGKIKNYKTKYQKSLYYVMISNMIIVLFTVVLMVYNDLLFSVIDDWFTIAGNKINVKMKITVRIAKLMILK